MIPHFVTAPLIPYLSKITWLELAPYYCRLPGFIGPVPPPLLIVLFNC